ncbi:MAG: UDP-N-acetylmuramate dehydrogenase [Huintestinicola sp.]
MTIDEFRKKAEELGCLCYTDKTLSGCTTFGTGGRIALLTDLCGTDAAKVLFPLLEYSGLPYYILGKGSNIIADDRDSGLIVLRTGKLMSDITVDGEEISCQSGATLSAVSAAARDNSLTGFEFAYGIPGNVGGAVFMNAGAYGGEIKDCIVWAEAVDKKGNVITISRDDMELGYRHSIFMKKDFIITKAVFRLNRGNKADITAKMDELTAKRREKQPLEYRSAGSTFKRPEGAFAAALIEQCGLKGYSCGDAQVSEKHSGFVINKGTASFEDAMAVINHVRRTVKEKTGYVLECEPEIITERTDIWDI